MCQLMGRCSILEELNAGAAALVGEHIAYISVARAQSGALVIRYILVI